jgi:membrane fusion protein (multidrug efflux system)
MNATRSAGEGRPRRARRRWAAPAGVVIVAAAVAALAVVLPERQTRKAPAPRPPLNVTVERVRRIARLPDILELTGTVEPRRIIKVSAEVDGRVVSYAGLDDPHTETGEPAWAPASAPPGRKLDDGDAVEANRPLLYLDTDLLEADRNQARAQLALDLLELQITRGLLQRSGMATDLEVKQKQTQVQRSRARLEMTEVRLKRAAIHAPVGGALNRFLVEEGEYVQTGQPVAEIVQMDPVKVVVDVPERDIGFVAPGAEHEITDDLGEVPPMVGRVSYVSRTADPLTRTTRIELTVADAGGRLHDGKILRVHLRRRVLRDAMMIPLRAVIPLGPPEAAGEADRPPAGDAYAVCVVTDGKARLIEGIGIDMDFIRGQRIRVLPGTGLSPGDLLVVEGHRLAGPGDPVKISNPQAAGGPRTAPASGPHTAPASAPADARAPNAAP